MRLASTAVKAGEKAVKWVPTALGKAWDLAWGGERVAQLGEKVVNDAGKTVKATQTLIDAGKKVPRRFTNPRRAAVILGAGGIVADQTGTADEIGALAGGAVAAPLASAGRGVRDIITGAKETIGNAVKDSQPPPEPGIVDRLTQTGQEIGSKFSWGPGSLIAAGLLGVLGFVTGGAMGPLIGGILAAVGAVAGQPIMEALTQRKPNDASNTTVVAADEGHSHQQAADEAARMAEAKRKADEAASKNTSSDTLVLPPKPQDKTNTLAH